MKLTSRRVLTVKDAGDPYLQRIGQQKPKSALMLSGAWLFESGFLPKDKVIVLVEDDTVVIRKVST